MPPCITAAQPTCNLQEKSQGSGIVLQQEQANSAKVTCRLILSGSRHGHFSFGYTQLACHGPRLCALYTPGSVLFTVLGKSLILTPCAGYVSQPQSPGIVDVSNKFTEK